jgi:hypothetical protein
VGPVAVSIQRVDCAYGCVAVLCQLDWPLPGPASWTDTSQIHHYSWDVEIPRTPSRLQHGVSELRMAVQLSVCLVVQFFHRDAGRLEWFHSTLLIVRGWHCACMCVTVLWAGWTDPSQVHNNSWDVETPRTPQQIAARGELTSPYCALVRRGRGGSK